MFSAEASILSRKENLSDSDSDSVGLRVSSSIGVEGIDVGSMKGLRSSADVDASGIAVPFIGEQ